MFIQDASRAVQKFLKFLGSAREMASLSKDRSTKVGAIALDDDYVIKSHGYNGFPRGVDDDVEARHERPAKYMYTVHAEMNVVAQAARPVLQGTTLLLTSLHPCPTCAGLLIQSGVKRIITPPPGHDLGVHTVGRPVWSEDARVAMEMFKEAGVEIVYYTPDASLA